MAQIITHDWNGYGISQASNVVQISKYRIPQGWVNATQMCQSNDKRWNDYARLKRSRDYWEALSADTQIPVSELVITILGDNGAGDQGTWVHPEIGVDVAQWVSIPFKIWANRTLTKIVAGNLTEGSAEAGNLALASAPKEIAEAIASVFCLGTIDPNLVQGLIANEIGNTHPQLKPHMEAAKKLLPLPVEQELLTVTELAKKYVQVTGKSLSKNNTDQGNAIALNKLLIELGLQVKNGDGNPSYLPTQQGKSYSHLVLQEGKDTNKTCQQLRWYPKVVEVLLQQPS